MDGWLDKSEISDEEVKDYERIWEYAADTRIKQQLNLDHAWNHVYARMGNTRKMILKKSYVYAIAAVVTILLAIGVFVKSARTITIETDALSQKEIVLPDGSLVSLNYNSTIRYPKQFEKPHRTVYVDGIVFFEVKPDKDVPFIVETHNAQIFVVGTSFEVNTLEKDKVEVIVESGKVLLYGKNKENNKRQQISLERGEKGLLDKTQLYREANQNINYLSWKTKVIEFRETPLKEVIQTLGKTYNAKITFAQTGLENLKLTARFDNDNVETVLEIITYTFNLDVEKNEKGYLLTRKE